MRKSSTESASGGIGLGGAVFIVFLVLKLTGKIGWSWWWVTCPLWGPVLLFLAIFVVVLACMGLAAAISR